jgi:serine/threonine-protein kinase
VSHAADTLIGTTLSERYLIHSLIGEGGMGKVYAAEHVLMHKRVAIKILHKDLTRMPDVVQRFEREAMAAANIDHPNVAAATDFGHLPDGSVFLVLEYVEGISLRSEIANGPVDVPRALHIGRQIASAMSSAHARGIVHRDLKPENVMLVEKAGDPDFVKVLDFGIAKVRTQHACDRSADPLQSETGQTITKSGMIFGTPEYMAPEQALGEEADGRADQFALGVILFELLTGRRPYRSNNQVGILGQQLKGPPPTVADAMPHLVLPEALSGIISRMMATERAQRFDDSRDVVEAFETILLSLQPSVLLRGSRPDASLGPSVFIEPATSSASSSAAPKSAHRQGGLVGGRKARRTRMLLKQLVFVLLGGIGVGASVVGIVLATKAGRAGVSNFRPSPSTRNDSSAQTVHAPEQLEQRAPATEVAFARSAGTAALESLLTKYPSDSSIILEIAKLQFANGQFSASVASIDRAIAANSRLAENAEVATLIWKSIQKRESSDAAFQLLEGPMGARGADILYDLLTTDGVRREIKARAEEHFTSGRHMRRSSPALQALVSLKLASSCLERRRAIELAVNLGDDRFLPLLEPLQSRVGCGVDQMSDCNECLRQPDLLSHAIEVIRKRSGK